MRIVRQRAGELRVLRDRGEWIEYLESLLPAADTAISGRRLPAMRNVLWARRDLEAAIAVVRSRRQVPVGFDEAFEAGRQSVLLEWSPRVVALLPLIEQDARHRHGGRRGGKKAGRGRGPQAKWNRDKAMELAREIRGRNSRRSAIDVAAEIQRRNPDLKVTAETVARWIRPLWDVPASAGVGK